MHNCKLTREHLSELLLDGIDTAPADVMSCESCREEFVSMKETLLVTGLAIEASVPRGKCWDGYHERLKSRLAGVEVTAEPSMRRRSRWLARSIRVPLPLAAAFLIVLGVSLFNAFRRVQPPRVNTTVSVVEVPVRVPVEKEKIVTRIIYKFPRIKPTTGKTDNSIIAKSEKPATLTGFKPLDEIKLTVIKGGAPNDK